MVEMFIYQWRFIMVGASEIEMGVVRNGSLTDIGMA